jgi:predicted dehydrogenase
VLLNQCPHQLDLLQWLFGMPRSLHAFCRFGEHHRIEVEDEVTTLLEYPNGATGVFTTTTGEAPGINRLEIAAENGLLIYDSTESFIRWQRNSKSVSAAIAENSGFEKPDMTEQTVPVDGAGGQHGEVLKNFAAAILRGEPLIAPAEQGIHSVELANAMLLSGWRNKAVSLPISSRGYARHLKARVETSTAKATLSQGPVADMTSSF